MYLLIERHQVTRLMHASRRLLQGTLPNIISTRKVDSLRNRTSGFLTTRQIYSLLADFRLIAIFQDLEIAQQSANLSRQRKLGKVHVILNSPQGLSDNVPHRKADQIKCFLQISVCALEGTIRLPLMDAFLSHAACLTTQDHVPTKKNDAS